ncbi:MAG: 50S ribosomal protein L29 [Francisellaceae bacterium]|jgi:large subunit ribosomal protein L29|nr:50S ribosomal protein L29 [Francisellaceae bacterium]MBT6539121.1 50S ribosomal protein L29 [Francisellaceae bacterium]
MSTVELRQLSIDELQTKLEGFHKEYFKLRIVKSNDSEFKQIHMFKLVRRNIARVKTLLVEKQDSKAKGVQA